MENKIFSSILLLLYGAVTVAASYKHDSDYTTHSYSFTSNCSNATLTTGQISVTLNSITSPTSTNFRALGFPNETMTVGSDTSGDLAPALTRSCVHSLDTATPNTTISVYSCADNGIPSCIINLTHLD